MSLLDVSSITMRFGGHVALDHVDLSCNPGEVTALIGPNGAGKTTLFNVICGLLEPSGGTVLIDGKDLTKLKPYKRARLGLARTFQRLELWSVLTVRENVQVAAELRSNNRRGANTTSAEVEAIVERVGLAAKIDQRVDELSTGQARLVEIARALATKPRLILLDEPASGLDDTETQELGKLLRDLTAEGLGVLLVEHDVELVMHVSDHIFVLDFGCIIADGTPHEIRTSPAVLAAYLGTSLDHSA